MYAASANSTLWEWAEYISDGLVVLGVAGEYLADLPWFARSLKRRKAKRSITHLSAVTLIVGVVFEPVALYKTNAVAAKSFASLSVETTQLVTSADQTSTQLQIASQTLNNSVTKVGRVQDALRRAEKKERLLSQRLASQELRASKLEDALTRVQKALQPRQLGALGELILIDALKQIPHGNVQINSAVGDTEAADYAAQIADAFKKAGWPPLPSAQTTTLLTRGGVAVFVRNARYPPSVAVPIIMALKAAGIDVTGAQGDFVPNESTVLILVGSKPLPDFTNDKTR